MKDVKCPYCNHPQNINHDDGYGFTEDEIHIQQCEICDRYFSFTTSIHYYYSVEEVPCLNGGEHNFKELVTVPVEYTKFNCTYCGEQRDPTDEEFTEILINRG